MQSFLLMSSLNSFFILHNNKEKKESHLGPKIFPSEHCGHGPLSGRIETISLLWIKEVVGTRGNMSSPRRGPRLSGRKVSEE